MRPCLCSMTRPVPRTSTCSVSLDASKALDGLLLASVGLVPLDLSTPLYRHQLWLSPCLSDLHMIILIQITSFNWTGNLRSITTFVSNSSSFKPLTTCDRVLILAFIFKSALPRALPFSAQPPPLFGWLRLFVSTTPLEFA